MRDSAFEKFSIAVVTPFLPTVEDANQAMDEAGLKSVLDHTCAGLSEARTFSSAVGGVIVSGSTGEQHSMSVEERIRLYEVTVEVASKWDVPVIAGVSASTTMKAVALAKAAVASGCKGLLLGLPPYVRLTDDEIKAYILTVTAELTEEISVVLYNNVARNGYGPSKELVVELFRGGHIWGMKYHVVPESLFLDDSMEMLKLEPKLRLFTGSDMLSRHVITGATDTSTATATTTTTGGNTIDSKGHPVYPKYFGLTSVIGNLFPFETAMMIAHLTSPGDVTSAGEQMEPDVAAATAAVIDTTAVRIPSGAETTSSSSSSPLLMKERGIEIHDRLVPVLQAALVGCTLPVGVKHALRSCMGVSGGYCRLPVGMLTEAKAAGIEEAINNFRNAY